MIKKAFRFIKKFFAWLGLLLGLYFIVGTLLSYMTVEEEANAPDELTIYILTNGVHTDLVLPTVTDQIDWSQEIKYSHTAMPNEPYDFIAMGWGDKGFYLETPTWGDLKASVAFKAATGLSSTAIHTTYYRRMLENENCKKIEISKEQYKRLIHYIKNSFQQDEQGHFKVIETEANYGNTDAFYEATGSYSLFKTCNSWANSGLKSSGQKACVWTAFDTWIFKKYE